MELLIYMTLVKGEKFMEIKLYKKPYTYQNKDGKEVSATRFYVKCGDALVPIEPTYFNKKDEAGNTIPDAGYSGRKAVLSSFAEVLPDKE